MNAVMTEQVTRLLKEMCVRVGADFDSMDFSKPGWYLEYSWTEEEQNDFRDWFIEELKDRKLTKALYGDRTTNKKMRTSRADWFLLNHGWKLKKEEGNDDEKTTTTQ